MASLSARVVDAGDRVQTRVRWLPTPVLVTGGALLLLGLARLLPAEGAGLGVRLAAAAFLVLVLPGWLVLRVFGMPDSVGVATAASFALSLVLVLVALGFAFLVGSSLTAALWALAALGVTALVVGQRLGREPEAASETTREDRRTALAILGASVPFAGLLWWSAGPIGGDLIFHLARMRKLAELDSLATLNSLNEFVDGSLHPGYAVPLWHGAVAFIARLAGADVVDAALYLPAVLFPLALLVAYGAGTAVFKRPAGGATFVLAQFALLALTGAAGRPGTGVFELLTSPPTVSRVLLAPTVLALAFAVIERRTAALVVSLLASSIALSVVHPSYTPFVALLIAGFLVVRLIVVRALDPLLKRGALALVAVSLPFLAYLAWLYPEIADHPSTLPNTGRRAFELEHYGNVFTFVGDSFGFAPETIARGGPVVVAGLLAIPFAGFAANRRWAQFALGGSLVGLTILLVPQLFTLLADVFTVSQARRLSAFLPLAFALAGAFVLMGRARLAAFALGLAAGFGVEFLVGLDFATRVRTSGPGWTVWFAVGGGLVALVAGAVLRPRGPDPAWWAVVAAGAFGLPLAITGLANVERPPEPNAMPAGLIGAVQDAVEPGDIVFSDPDTAFRISAYSPVYVSAAPAGHVSASRANRPVRRQRDGRQFFVRDLTEGERDALLARYDADWVIVDKELGFPEDYLAGLRLVYDGGRYALYAAPGRG